MTPFRILEAGRADSSIPGCDGSARTMHGTDRQGDRVAAGTPRFGWTNTIPSRELTTVGGETIRVPDDAALVHLQFRRYAVCPVCNLHLRTFAHRYGEIVRAGIIEIAVFHSPADDLRGHDLPFALVADPARALYREFEVGKSIRSVLDPRAWGAMLRGIAAFGVRLPRLGESTLGLPADFLIAPSGALIDHKYGSYADDQWSVDDLLNKVEGTNDATW